MQSTSEGYFDVIGLAKELRSEKLFVQSELESLRQLNERLEKSALELAQATWTSTQQRSNLKQIFAQGDFSSSSCCQRTDYVLSPVFVDAHKVLRYQDALVLSELIQRVRRCPAMASVWLVAAEGGRACGPAARALCSGLYAGAGAPLRRVLRHLARHRVATSEDPRRMIGLGSSSFSRLYCEMVEGFRPARLFLMAALRGPLLPLLQLDEYLLVDPDKAMDRIKKYCSASGSTSECQQKLARYRKWTITSLATSAGRFVTSLSEHWPCFPPTVAWVVRQTALALRATRRIPEEDIHSICTDLVFTNFICQAIANPEAYGITDIPITNIGRFNLVQVAQTLQILCLMKYQEVDGKLRDLYSRFEKDSVYSLLDIIIEDESYSTVPDESQGLGDLDDNGFSEGLLESTGCEEDDTDISIQTEPVINANVALFTRSDLQLLVSLLKRIPTSLSNGFDSSPEQINLSASSTSILEQDFCELSLADKNNDHNSTAIGNGVAASQDNSSVDDTEAVGDTDMACGVTPDGGEIPKIESTLTDLSNDEVLSHLLRTIHPEQISRLQTLLNRLPDCNFTKESITQKSTKGKHDGTNGSGSPSKGQKKSNKNSQLSQEVLVIKLPGDSAYEPIGMVPESKVLEWHYASVAAQRADLSVPLLEALSEGVEVQQGPGGVLDGVPGAGDPGGLVREVGEGPSVGEQQAHRGQEKRTRFSLSHDEGSIGNTSDNLEAVSEAASNHSVTSSLEMETEDQNDNLSDMVSANVSGRGSPNISGRDTPSSQVTEGDASVPGLAMPQPHRHHASVPLSSTAASKQAKLLKRTRNDIEDKFCKFEIKKLLESDETISIISDTWSTDVLASDSETIGETPYERNIITPSLALGQQHILAGGLAQPVLPLAVPLQPDASETASESAWSTDALVSDSDRMTEVDMDDCNSVGRSEPGIARLENDVPSVSLLQPELPQPHYQFSPLNNINRDALLNRQQMSAASSVHTAHPDNMLPVAAAESEGPLENGDSHEAEDFQDNVDSMVVLRSPNNRSSISSSLYMGVSNPMSSSSESSTGGRDGGRRPVGYHERLSQPGAMAYASGSGLVNGYSVSPFCSGPDLHKDHLTPDSPGQQINFPSYSGSHERPHVHDMNMFDFNLRRGLNEAINSQVLESGVSTPEGMFHSSNSPFVQAMSNGNATSRWLNDPCQRFPTKLDPNTPPNTQPGCSVTSDLGTLDTNLTDNKRSNTDSMFRPIRAEASMSDINDSGISDLNACNMMPFLNGNEDISNQDFSSTILSDVSFNASNGTNGLSERFHTETSQRGTEFDPGSQDTSSDSSLLARMMTSQHNFTSSNLISRVLKSSESRTSIINISSSRIDKATSKQSEIKTDSPLNGISCGSAISLSTLSVNSADTSTSDRSSSQDVNSENLTERRVTPPLGNVSILNSTDVKVQRVSAGNNGANTLPRNSTPCTGSMKPGASTGAIPKSISFDATAEKSHRYHSGRRAPEDSGEGSGLNFGDLKNNMKRSGGNFLNKIKQFRNKSRGFTASAAGFGKRNNQAGYIEDITKAGGDCDIDNVGIVNRNEEVINLPNVVHKSNAELSDDILAKYRRKASSSSSEAAVSESGQWGPRPRPGSLLVGPPGDASDGESAIHSDIATDVEFESLKKKLRHVLSNMDVSCLELTAGRPGTVSLVCALRLEGSGAAASALAALGASGTAPLAAVRAEARARLPYLTYLARCRRALVATITALNSETDWQRAEALRQAALVAAGRARVSLATRESRLASLQERLRSGLADEKRDLLAHTLISLNQEMAREDSWAGATEWELEQAALTVERAVMGRVYLQAMFPNGDGDILRDQLLHEHIARLSAGGIGLPERGLAGAPWLPAQRILAHLPVYKTPRDKVECVVRCVSSIMSLLSLASDGGTPGADHLTPVLVYVIIKANPPSLLSTVQFVSTFLNSPLEGGHLYCWTQFCSAVEYIKTMDYTRGPRR